MSVETLSRPTPFSPDFLALPKDIPPNTKEHITVIGAGTGLLIGRALQQLGHQVTVIYDHDLRQGRRAMDAATQFLPIADVKDSKLIKEGTKESFSQYENWAQRSDITGVHKRTGVEPIALGNPDFDWPDYLSEIMGAKLKRLDEPVIYRDEDMNNVLLSHAYEFPSFAFDNAKFLAWQREIFEERGGELRQQKVTPQYLDDLEGKVVIAAGAGLAELLGEKSLNKLPLSRGYVERLHHTDAIPLLDGELPPILSSGRLVVAQLDANTIQYGAPNEDKKGPPTPDEVKNLRTRVMIFADQTMKRDGKAIFPGIPKAAFTAGAEGVRSEVIHGYRPHGNGPAIETREFPLRKEVLVLSLTSVGATIGPAIAAEVAKRVSAN